MTTRPIEIELDWEFTPKTLKQATLECLHLARGACLEVSNFKTFAKLEPLLKTYFEGKPYTCYLSKSQYKFGSPYLLRLNAKRRGGNIETIYTVEVNEKTIPAIREAIDVAIEKAKEWEDDHDSFSYFCSKLERECEELLRGTGTKDQAIARIGQLESALSDTIIALNKLRGKVLQNEIL